MTATELQDAATRAHETLRNSPPAEMSGEARMERKRLAERARLEAVKSLGVLKTSDAADALIALLPLTEHHRRFQNQVLAQLRRSPVEDLAARLADRAPVLGVTLLTVRRDPVVLPVLERMIEEGEALATEGEATRHWCIAVCAAASYGHAPSRERLDWLFSNADALSQKSWLAPMLRALCSGEPEDAWQLGAPVRALVDAHPQKAYAGPLWRAVLQHPAPDPRWADVAMQLLERRSRDALDPLVRFAKSDEALRDRLAEMSGPLPLEVLARVGDGRAVERLRARLNAARSFHEMRGVVSQLRLVPHVDESLHELALISLLETQMEFHEEEAWELFGDDDMPEEQLFFRIFTSDANVDRLLIAFDATYFRSEASPREAAKGKQQIRTRLERLRPRG